MRSARPSAPALEARAPRLLRGGPGARQDPRRHRQVDHRTGDGVGPERQHDDDAPRRGLPWSQRPGEPQGEAEGEDHLERIVIKNSASGETESVPTQALSSRSLRASKSPRAPTAAGAAPHRVAPPDRRSRLIRESTSFARLRYASAARPDGVRMVGDVNGDGFDDLIVGAPRGDDAARSRVTAAGARDRS